MKQIKENKVFIVIVLIILFSPLVLSLCNLVIHKLSDSKDRLRLNFKKHYFLKEELLGINKILKENFFGVYFIPNRSLDFENGWCVVGDHFGDALSESKALKVFSKNEIDRLKVIIKKHDDWLKNKGVKFYIAIAPNKLTAYDTLVPIAKRSRNTKLQQIDSLCTKLGVSFVDMGEKFKDQDSLRLYHKTDTHWNDIGGFLGYEASMDVIKNDFSENKFENYKLNELKRYNSHELLGDLNKMLKRKTKEEWLHIDLDTLVCAEKVADRLSVPEGYYRDPTKYETRYENSEKDLKFLAFRDSFMGYCLPFFVENFKESIFVWHYKLNWKLVNEEKPDVVFLELVERDIDLLLEN